MQSISKGDLYYKNYSWKAVEGDNSEIRGFPDNVLLNRSEGYEVLHFINKFIEGQQSWREESLNKKKELGTKIEKMIHDHLPSNIRSHGKIHEWIVANWNTQF